MATSNAMQSDSDRTVRDGHLVGQRFVIEPFDPWRLLANVPQHKSYRLFSEPDGPLRIGVGAAARVARAPGTKTVPWSLLHRSLRASLGEVAGVARVFFSAAFDLVDPFGDEDDWRGFAPVEICVPDVTFERSGSDFTMTIISSDERMERTIAAARAILSGGVTVVSPGGEATISWNDDRYATAVSSALERIAGDDIEKIVVARPIDVALEQAPSIPAVLQRLEEAFPRCFLFAHRPGGSHRGAAPTFLGATPERLVRVESGTVHTGAIAGTAPRGVSARMDERYAQDLLKSEKEQHEHNVVGEMIVETLEPFCDEVVRDPMRFLKLANVQHLWSPIRGSLRDDATVLDVAEALHPTPAVGGQPRRAAIDAIRAIEPWARGLYAGVVGNLDLSGDGELAVAIRSALVDGRRARLFAGAGIVEGSQPRREVEETRAKAGAMLDALEAT